MKKVKDLEDFILEESFINDMNDGLLEEGLKLNFNFIRKIYDFFKSKFKRAWLHTANFIYKSGALKSSGVKVHLNGSIKGSTKPRFKLFGRKSEVFENFVSRIGETTGLEKFDDVVNYNMDGFDIDEGAIPKEHPSTGVPNVDVKEFVYWLKFAFKKKKPMFIWGAPGIGKTQIIKDFGKSNGLAAIEFSLSLRDPVDFIGLPSIENGKTIYNSPGIFPPSADTEEGKAEEKTKGGILFFDEMNLGHPMVIKSAMRLVLERELDNYILPRNWIVLAAGNRGGNEAPSATQLEAAMANRWKHINFVPEDEDWIEWARSDKAKDDDGNDLVHDDIISFIQWAKSDEASSKSWLHVLDDDSDDNRSPAWPSPRSWTEASEQYIWLLQDAESEGRIATDREIELAISMNVGRDAALAFMAYLHLVRSIDVKALKYVYSAPNKAPLPKKGRDGKYDPSQVYAIISAIVYTNSMNTKKLTVKEFDNCVQYCIRLDSGEFAAKFIRMITDLNPHLINEDSVMDALKRWSIKYEEIINLE